MRYRRSTKEVEMTTKKIDVKAKLIHCNACQQNVTLPHDCPSIKFKRGLSHKPSHKPGELRLDTLGDILKLAEKLKMELCGHLPPETEQTSSQMDEYAQILKAPIVFHGLTERADGEFALFVLAFRWYTKLI